MELAFYLGVLLLIFIDFKDLLNVKSLIDMRLFLEKVSSMEKSDLVSLDSEKRKNFVFQTFELYFYFAIMIIGLFSSQWIFFVSMIVITLISGVVAKKLENDRKKFTTYFVFDKIVSMLVLAFALINKFYL